MSEVDIVTYGHKVGCPWEVARFSERHDASEREATPELVASLREQVRALTEAFRGEAPDTAEAVIYALGDCLLDNPGAVVMAKHARQMETRAREAEAKVCTLSADNAALLTTLRTYYTAERTTGQDDGPTVGEWHIAIDAVEEMLDSAHPGATLLAEMEALRKERDDFRRVARELAQAMGFNGHPDSAVTFASTLRVRVAELEEDKALWDARESELKAEADHLRGVIVGRTSERDAAQQRAKALRDSLLRTMRTQDAFDSEACWCSRGRLSAAAPHEDACREYRRVLSENTTTGDGR